MMQSTSLSRSFKRLNDQFSAKQIKANLQAQWLPLAFFVAWVFLMLAMPYLQRLDGGSALVLGLNASVLLQTGTVLTFLLPAWGVRRTSTAVATIALLSWSMEALGTATGLPFGNYHYTNRLHPQILHVPLLIPLAWLMMLPPAWAIARRLSGIWRGPTFVLASAAAITAWDLFLDPQMVAWQLWVWETPGGYFGIPWINFGGWLLTALLITVVVRPAPLPTGPMLLVYSTTWLLESVGLAFYFGLPGPALVGCGGMGLFVLAAWRGQPESRSAAKGSG